MGDLSSAVVLLPLVAAGAGVGFLVGLTGVGGGSLMTPLLLLVGGYSPSVAIGTDLAYGAVTKTLGGWRHLRAGNVDLRLSRSLATRPGRNSARYSVATAASMSAAATAVSR